MSKTFRKCNVDMMREQLGEASSVVFEKRRIVPLVIILAFIT
jgi:hypothetical protein